MASLVQCMVCGKSLRMINALHLRTHRMTVEEYRHRWPDALLCDPETELERRKKISGTLTGTHRPEEVKTKIGNGNRGKKRTEETKAKLSESHMGNTSHLGHKHSPKTRAKISRALTGRKLSPEHCAKMSEITKGIKRSPETCEKHRQAYMNQANSLNRGKNGLESHFEEHYTTLPIAFTGDGGRFIRLKSGKLKVPDFIVPGTKIVIELLCDFWHRGEDPKVLIKQYKEVGYTCIVFWEHEVYEMFPPKDR